MIQLTKELFISSIEAIRIQTQKDNANAVAIAEVFNTDGINPYDNSILVKALFKMLQLFFPKDANDFCEIEHYCFDMNFGKVADQELITPEDLWDRLTDTVIGSDANSAFKPSKFLIDEVGLFPSAAKKLWLTKKEDLILPIGERIRWRDKQGANTDLRSTEPIPSTHPLIDDYPKQVTILDFITKEKEEARETIKQNSLYSICYANQLFLEGKISALESIEKELKLKQ